MSSHNLWEFLYSIPDHCWYFHVLQIINQVATHKPPEIHIQLTIRHSCSRKKEWKLIILSSHAKPQVAGSLSINLGMSCVWQVKASVCVPFLWRIIYDCVMFSSTDLDDSIRVVDVYNKWTGDVSERKNFYAFKH